MIRVCAAIACCTLVCLGFVVSSIAAQPSDTRDGLTALAGIRVGHYTLDRRPTGCTVVLTEAGAVATVDVRGAAPGTRETALLDPVNTVQQVHAIVLSGGSAFGLAAADGVMRYLEERKVGYRTRAANVPIVPAAILYDLGIGDDPTIHPTAECGYQAALAATTGPVAEGSVGAGTGATVGKIGGPGRAMKGGIGTAMLELGNGVRVAALMAVNSVGNIVDPDTGQRVAGVRTPDGSAIVDAQDLLRGSTPLDTRAGENTTIGIVATNARLSKAELAIVARMAHDGLARAVRPAHTPSDGDTIFAIATGEITDDVSLLRIGALAADATADAILRGVRAATGLPGYPSAGDLQGGVR
jgi:L-aminopeptidase/D-esterase-like protein